MVPNDTLRYAIDQIETSTLIDPHFEPASNRRYYEVYEGLTALGADGTPGPALALRWERLEPTRVRFHLRSTARFHDGSPVTADDVVFSFERARTPRKSFTVAGRLGSIQTMRVIDAHTVDVVTDRADPLLAARLAELMIVSSKDEATPIGSGPYRMAEYTPAQVIRLERWESHDSRKPPFHAVEALTMPLADRAAAIRAGAIDLAMIAPSDRERLQAAGCQVVTSPVTANTGYFLDTVNPTWPTHDPRVRLAINYAVNKERLIREVFGGLASVTEGQFAPTGCAGHTAAIAAFPYNPDLARALLREAGYADGFHVTIDAVGYSPYDVPKAEHVAADLAAVGITSDIAVIADLETSLQRWFGNLPRGHLSPTSLAVAPAMDVEYALLWFDRDHPTRHYANEVFDRIHRASQTELDSDRRESLLHESAVILHDDPPFLWLCGERSMYAVSSSLDGFRPRTDGCVVPDSL